MKLLALTKYGRLAASTRQRLMQYEPALARAGVEIGYAPLFGDDYMQALAQGKRAGIRSIAASYAGRLGTLLRRTDADVVWLHYEAFPFLPAPFERLLSRLRRPVILDFDDAIFHNYDDHPHAFARRLLGRKLETTIRAADAVTVGNAYLQDYATRFNPRVQVLPTVVDTSLYRPAAHRPAGPLVVGWIGSPSTWRYVEPVLPGILQQVAAAGAVFRAVGAGPGAARWAGVESIDWSEDSEIAAVQSMDIGIMPLPDEQWARGKCGYKLIQYMACGLPVVASPVGVNTRIVRPGVNGFLVEDAAGWAMALGELLASPALRDRLGQAGRVIAEQEYSLAAFAPPLVALVTSMARADATAG